MGDRTTELLAAAERYGAASGPWKKGGEPEAMMAELYSARESLCVAAFLYSKQKLEDNS